MLNPKKFPQLVTFLLVLCSFATPKSSWAQRGNEWIDYDKTYWKFKITDEGIYRIPQSTIASIGISPSTKGADFQLWHNGKEIPIFVTNDDVFGGTDYIEFFGTTNDGIIDKGLYLADGKHSNPFKNLFSDTGVYFLTIDNSKANLRFLERTSPITSPTPSPETYCWNTVFADGTASFWKGKSNGPKTSTGKHELYSSQFENGEGYVIARTSSNNPITLNINCPNAVDVGLSARLKTASCATARDSAHRIKLFWNNSEIADAFYGVDDIFHFDLPIKDLPVNPTNNLRFEHRLTGLADQFGIPYWRLEYTRNWNFSGFDYVRFALDAKSSVQYIKINNFNHGSIAPKLFDITNNKWYIGDISTPSVTRFLIEPSLLAQEYILFANGSSKIRNLTAAQRIQFTNYANAANQGDYLIITHKNLQKNVAGRNPIQDYKNYRESNQGGNYKVVVADIEELYDQFAYGTYTHPLAITHFVDYGRATWSNKPQNLFLIGKGVSYTRYKELQSSTILPSIEGYVPTYGFPGADNAFVTNRDNWQLKLSVGRLTAWNSEEVAQYLNKMKAYEASLAGSTIPRPSSEIWKKQILHLAGGDNGDIGLQDNILLPALNASKNIIQKPFTSAQVHTYAKNTRGMPSVLDDKRVDSLINTGTSMITFYGHATSGSFDFNLKEPSFYNTSPKFPMLNAFGCDISAIFKVTLFKTVTEEYVKAPNSGAITSLGSNNQGWTNVHSPFMQIFYNSIANTNYGQTIGQQLRSAEDSFLRAFPETPFQTSFRQAHMESLILQGDPATRSHFNAPKPDYYVGTDEMLTIPSAINTSIDSFQLQINSFNLGKTSDDSVNVRIEHINPVGASKVIKEYTLTNMGHRSSNTLWIKIDKTKDIGVNKYRVSIDYNNRFEEMSESNNVGTLDVFILSDNIVPIYPYDFSIVHNTDPTLKASTLNPFNTKKRYRIEIDTTEQFNSTNKQSTIIESKGGVIKWKPSLILQDSVVYYWRTSIDSLISGEYNWIKSSFVYLKDGSDGWNQSHYYQYKYNNFDSLRYDESRKFSYGSSTATIENSNFIMELPGPDYSNSGEFNNVIWNGATIHRNSCFNGGALQIFVFDSSTGAPWRNNPVGNPGKQNSAFICASVNSTGFVFPINTANDRNNARKFLDSIPNGNYVFIKNHINNVLWGGFYTDVWKNDTITYGAGNSLYHSFLKLGFNTIDSFNRRRLFSMFGKKGFPDFTVQQDWTDSVNQKFKATYTFPITDVQGKMNSVVVGPASAWKTLKWRTSSYFDTMSKSDSSVVTVWGINKSGIESIMYRGQSRDTTLAYIDAAIYPKIRLQWHSTDSLYHTSAQLDYWRVLYDPLPEAALNPSILYSFTDSVEVGQLMNLNTAIETLTELPMDSMLVRYKVIDANGIQHLLADKKYRKLNGNDSLHAKLSFDPKPYPGKNYLFIEANPDENQPEQYHPNNLGYIPFEIKTDNYAPLLDVTFDGVHILDKDIVSSKPFIKVLLRDENKFLALKDTSKLKLYLRYIEKDPNAPKERVSFDGTKCKFIPADLSSGRNEAYIEYRPTFEQDGLYQLYAEGIDEAGNESGQGNQYSISFEVVNRSTITNLLNYPNPFSTSTAFVFTLTGSQIPTQFKIQILSVTGKVVREITKQELGPIRIGRNITEYKWDGRDQFGQLLGNGVYLYRVVTTINGEDIERRSNSTIDKFNKNGYTKMYIMR